MPGWGSEMMWASRPIVLCVMFLFGGFLLEAAAAAPLINVWYGEDQIFGPRVPQPFVNILGNVRDSAGLAWLSYSLNGGPPTLLSIGPDGRRLECQGDFGGNPGTGNQFQVGAVVVVDEEDVPPVVAAVTAGPLRDVVRDAGRHDACKSCHGHQTG